MIERTGADGRKSPRCLTEQRRGLVIESGKETDRVTSIG
jgi:hypothetical protein